MLYLCICRCGTAALRPPSHSRVPRTRGRSTTLSRMTSRRRPWTGPWLSATICACCMAAGWRSITYRRRKPSCWPGSRSEWYCRAAIPLRHPCWSGPTVSSKLVRISKYCLQFSKVIEAFHSREF